MISLRRGCCRNGSGSFSGSSSGKIQSWRRVIGTEPVRRNSRGSPLLVPALSHSRSLYKLKEDEQVEAARSHSTATCRTPRLSLSGSSHCSFTPAHSSSCIQAASQFPAANSPTSIENTKTATTSIFTRFLRSQTSFRRNLSTNIPVRFYSHKATTTTPLPIMVYEGKWTAATVRTTFLEYFAERGHTIGW